MKSSWIGIGFSHHSVPSLSKTAMRSSTGTGSEPSRRRRGPRTPRSPVWPGRRASSRSPPATLVVVSAVVIVGLLFARHHRDGFALEVDVGLDQSGTESRKSTLTFRLNGTLTGRSCAIESSRRSGGAQLPVDLDLDDLGDLACGGHDSGRPDDRGDGRQQPRSSVAPMPVSAAASRFIW